MDISQLAQNNKPQLVRKIYDKSKEYKDVIDLTLGDPDIPTPELVKEATTYALKNNYTKYTANAGLIELRQAISEDVKKRTGVEYNINEISVTAGAMGALYLSSVSMYNPGDEVIVVEPHWPNYTNMIEMCRAIPKYVSYIGIDVNTLGERIEKLVTDKTKSIVINSPSNPTGIVIPFNVLKDIANIAKKYNLYVVTDEVYHTIVFDGEYHSILEIPEMKERTILIDSLSKRFSMTGYRVGFVCAPENIARSVAVFEENVNSCACMFAQYASIVALKNCDKLEKEICATFKERCVSMASELSKCDKLILLPVKATFYLFINITKTGLTSEEFAYKLLEEKHIAVVPGNAFNNAGEGYIRIACTLSTERLIDAAKKIVDFVNGL